MALANYADLQSSVGSWLHRSDLAANIPDFILLAEERIARELRVRKQVVNTTIPTVAGTQTITLPTDFIELENITVIGVNPPRQLHVVTPEIMDEKFPAGYITGMPVVYALIGDTIQLGPTPDAVYSIGMDYYKRFDIASTDTNWLLTNHPSLYLFGALAEAAPFLQNDERAPMWDAKFVAAMSSLNESDDSALRSGSAMRVRAL